MLGGCASTQLYYNTVDLATSTDSLLTKQILYNFANFIDSPVAIPAQMVISSGTATTSNSVTPNFTTPLDAGITTSASLARAAAATTTNTFTSATASKTLGVSGTDSWNQSWAYTTITDPDRLKRLQALYRYAVEWSEEPDGIMQFVLNFPLVYKSASYSKPLCLEDETTKKHASTDQSNALALDTQGDKADKAGKSIQVCVTAAGGTAGAAGLSHGATTKTFTRQIPDEHYLTGPTCIVCSGPQGRRTINPLIFGPWLRWQDLSGRFVRPERVPRPGDVLLGQSGHYAFFTDGLRAQRFVDFSVAVLSATTIGGSAAPGAAGSTSGGGGSAGTKSFLGTDANGGIVTFTPAP
jgi:hypothetical protein